MLKCLSLMFLLSIALNSMDLKVQQIEIDNDNNKRLKLMLIDENGQQINIDNNDIFIIEGNDTIQDHSLICPPIDTLEPVSSFLMIDRSGSMHGPWIEIAKDAANLWVDRFNKDKVPYECGLGVFSSFAELKKELTSNHYSLKMGISSIYADGGTNYEMAFLWPQGAINNLKNAKYPNKVLIFLTDGIAYVNDYEVIKQCQKNGIKVYSIVISNTVPSSLINISQASGGDSWGGVNSKEQLLKIYNSIYDDQKVNYEPCLLKWQSDQLCSRITLEIRSQNIKKEIFYSPLSKSSRPYLEIAKDIIELGDLEGVDAFDSSFTIQAKNGDIEIFDIKFDNSYLEFLTDSIPKGVLKKDSLITLPFRFHSRDSLIISELQILSSCENKTLKIKGGKEIIKVSPQKRYGFGTTAILTDLGSTQTPMFKGFNSGFGLQFYISKTLALKLSYGFVEVGSKPNVNDIINNIDLGRAAGAHLRINFSENENIIFYSAPGLVYRDISTQPEFNDGWKRMNGQYSITVNVPFGVEWFFEHNLGLSFQYDINYTRYFDQEGIIKSGSLIDDDLTGSSISISPIPTITISYYIN